MAQEHLDRLTAIDASFLHQEGPNSHMHIGGVVIFDGPPPEYDEFLDHLRGRLHLVPRYRQKLLEPPFDSGRPLWADDPNFNLEYHVRHSALPAPGAEDQLLRLVARCMSQQLDRSKPLWELYLVEGLEDDRFALISKTHHALVDGVSGADLMTVLFDLTKEPMAIDHPGTPWAPRPEPGAAEVLAAGVRGLARTGIGMAGRVLEAAARPQTAIDGVREAVEGLGEIAWAGLNPAPETPFNVEIGPHRRYAVVRNELADFKEVKDALGGTVNDVVLTIVSGGIAKFLRSRGVRTQGLELRALVPVSVRGKDEHHTLGNRIAAMRGPLPVFVDDPVQRLGVVRAGMDGLKESKQALGAEVLANVQNLAPPTVLAQASRLNFSTRLFNLIVTNVPGPQFPLYVLGRRLRDLFPVAFLPKEHALAIAIMSYDGRLNFGLLGDYDAMWDLDVVAEGIAESLDELLVAARKKSGKGSAAPKSAAAPKPKRAAPKAKLAEVTELPVRSSDDDAGEVVGAIKVGTASASSGARRSGPASAKRAARKRSANGGTRRGTSASSNGKSDPPKPNGNGSGAAS